jgi:5-methylcytosine-specific restriction endonuclease McrA
VLLDSSSATLDHVRPRADGGSNDASNLLTACDECNTQRGDLGPAEFAHVLAVERGRFEDFEIEILERVIHALTAPLPT